MLGHFALPLRLDAAGSLAELAQDSPAEISQSVVVLLATRPGERRTAPDYGLVDPLGAGADADLIADAVAEWEDRADPASVEITTTAVGEQQVTVQPADPTDEEA